MKNISYTNLFSPLIKSFVAALTSGFVMFVILKFFDRSVWIKKLSFLGNFESLKSLPFEKFVLDTRYTGNLLLLTIIVSFFGGFVYIAVAILLRSNEVFKMLNVLKRLLQRKKIASIPKHEREVVSPGPTDSEI